MWTYRQIVASSAVVLGVHTYHGALALSPAPIFSVPNIMDTLTSGLASMGRLSRGITVMDESNLIRKENADVLILYDAEGDANCRAVREVITELDLVVQVKPQPIGFNNNKGPKVPMLDVQKANSKGEGMMLKGKDVILDYLYSEYTVMGSAPESSESLLDVITRGLPSLLRLGRGIRMSRAIGSKEWALPRPKKPLILYNYEGNQFCRLVREVLTELNIPYESRSAGKGSPRREELFAESGATQCPYLIDGNTGVKMAESADIIDYLYENYALFTPPDELLEMASAVVTPLLKPFYSILAPIQAGSYDKDFYLKTIQDEISSSPVVIYTYKLSPFCTEATSVLDGLGVEYKEISLGLEWVPGLIDEGGAEKRATLGSMTGQTSLPHIFVGGKSVGGLFSGNPGLIPAVENGSFTRMLKDVSPAMTRTLRVF